MDTVRIEYMIVNNQGSVITNWLPAEGSIINDSMTYIPRAYQVRERYTTLGGTSKVRVRVVSEQSNRIVDIIQ